MPIKADRGYVIPAIGEIYQRCGQHLATSIKHYHPHADITVVTGDDLPFGDQGGQANDWQMFYVSPYRQTIKLEADMLCTGPIDHWWTLFENRDVVISQGCRDYRDRPASTRFYRRIFDQNHLPDVYNAITYWRRSITAQEFFQLVRQIFDQWSAFRTLLRFPDEQPTTDVVYAIAAMIIGPEQVTLPSNLGPTIVHMKKHVIGTRTEDWTHELVWEMTNPGLRINTIAQHGLFHYHVKDWL